MTLPNHSYESQFADLSASITRRHFFSKSSGGIGAAVLAHMLGTEDAAAKATANSSMGGVLKNLHVPAKVKRVIYLFMSGGPSQIDMWDHKPRLRQENGQELPAEVQMGQRLTSMSGNQASLPLAGSIFDFK